MCTKPCHDLFYFAWASIIRFVTRMWTWYSAFRALLCHIVNSIREWLSSIYNKSFLTNRYHVFKCHICYFWAPLAYLGFKFLNENCKQVEESNGIPEANLSMRKSVVLDQYIGTPQPTQYSVLISLGKYLFCRWHCCVIYGVDICKWYKCFLLERWTHVMWIEHSGNPRKRNTFESLYYVSDFLLETDRIRLWKCCKCLVLWLLLLCLRATTTLLICLDRSTIYDTQWAIVFIYWIFSLAKLKRTKKGVQLLQPKHHLLFAHAWIYHWQPVLISMQTKPNPWINIYIIASHQN